MAADTSIFIVTIYTLSLNEIGHKSE